MYAKHYLILFEFSAFSVCHEKNSTHRQTLFEKWFIFMFWRLYNQNQPFLEHDFFAITILYFLMENESKNKRITGSNLQWPLHETFAMLIRLNIMPDALCKRHHYAVLSIFTDAPSRRLSIILPVSKSVLSRHRGSIKAPFPRQQISIFNSAIPCAFSVKWLQWIIVYADLWLVVYVICLYTVDCLIFITRYISVCWKIVSLENCLHTCIYCSFVSSTCY